MARRKIQDKFSDIKDIQARHRARRFAEGRCYVDGNPLDEKSPGVLYRACPSCREKRKMYMRKKSIVSMRLEEEKSDA